MQPRVQLYPTNGDNVMLCPSHRPLTNCVVPPTRQISPPPCYRRTRSNGADPLAQTPRPINSSQGRKPAENAPLRHHSPSVPPPARCHKWANSTMLPTFTSIPTIGSGNRYFMPIVPCDHLRFLSYLTHKSVSLQTRLGKKQQTSA
jgi:hypothetical protein